MNLHDVVPTQKRLPRFNSKDVKAAIETAIETADHVHQIEAIAHNRIDLSRDQRNSLTAIASTMIDTREAQRRQIADTVGALPESLWVKDEPLTRFARSPRVMMGDLRGLADAFGFVILPWEYFTRNDKSTSAMSESIDAFVGEAEFNERYIPYVICPVDYYSLERHVKASDDLPIYAGPFGQAFMGINMSIPMFRQLARRVNNLEAKASNTDARLDSVETELKNLARRLGEIQRAEERRQREAAIQAAAAARQAALVTEQIAAVRRFIPYDPMLIALPSGKDIHSEAVAVVGPCWGPDFEDVVATARGYKRIAGQRKMISRIGW